MYCTCAAGEVHQRDVAPVVYLDGHALARPGLHGAAHDCHELVARRPSDPARCSPEPKSNSVTVLPSGRRSYTLVSNGSVNRMAPARPACRSRLWRSRFLAWPRGRRFPAGRAARPRGPPAGRRALQNRSARRTDEGIYHGEIREFTRRRSATGSSRSSRSTPLGTARGNSRRGVSWSARAPRGGTEQRDVLSALHPLRRPTAPGR